MKNENLIVVSVGLLEFSPKSTTFHGSWKTFNSCRSGLLFAGFFGVFQRETRKVQS